MNLGFHNKPAGAGLLSQFDCHLVGGIGRISTSPFWMATPKLFKMDLPWYS